MINQEKSKKSFRFKIGIFLFIISNIAFVLLLCVPTLDLTIEQKTKLGLALAILGEILFWASGYLLGKEILQKYKRYLNPVNWFKKNKDDLEDNS